MLSVGDKAPQFSVLDSHEQEVSLNDFLGKNVILYFYPKDKTPGCTTEAIEFSAAQKRFSECNAIVLGVSKDSCKSHLSFVEKHDLKVCLLSDETGEIVESYGVWREKKNYGKTYMGIVRSTFWIDEKGHIKNIWDSVRVKGHVDEVLVALEEE